MYKLGVGGVISLFAYVAMLCAILSAMLVQDSGLVGPGFDSDGLLVLMTYASSFFVALGCLSYIYVGYRAPRPNPLHCHGAVLMLMLAETVLGIFVWYGRVDAWKDRYDIFVLWRISTFGIFGVRRSLFIMLMTQKMSSLSSQATRRLSVRFWGLMTAVSTLVASWGVAIPGLLYTLHMLEQGVKLSTALNARTGLITGYGDVDEVDQAVLGSLFLLGILCGFGIFFGSLAFIVASWRAVRFALAKLIARRVAPDMLVKVRALVWQQFTGVLLSLATGSLYNLAVGYSKTELRGMDKNSKLIAVMCARAFDFAADVVGILLLSGIGALLLREDPLAGDVGAGIRAKLHAAVLSSRVATAFEGVVCETTSHRCIVSFPGKFLAEWNALTWRCEEGSLSSACVFLPSTDCRERFGQHVPCPKTPGKCWCHSLYGGLAPWGCMWFDVWRSNVEKAMELRLELVAVFFPKEAGLGVVAWQDLGSTDLWDGVGLGGSQKAELAYLNEIGYPVVYEDLDATKLMLGLSQV